MPNEQLSPEANDQLLLKIIALLQKNRKIEAVKAYVDTKRVGLADAKAVVDAIEREVKGWSLNTSGANVTVDWMEQVRAQLRKGSKIEAIKIYREATGLGLKEAKDAVEALMAGQAPEALPTQPEVDADWMEQVKAQLRKGSKIEAIKIYRSATGLGLKEAKDAVEAMGRGQ